MTTTTLDGVRIAAIAACVPARSEDCLERCTALYGSAGKALSVVRATGIRSRRVLEPGVTALDLCVDAAKAAMRGSGASAGDFGAVICVTFTPERSMPCNACVAQSRLGLDRGVVAFDLGLACSGWLYGLHVAGLLAKALGRRVLLLDGDSQSVRLDPSDAATVPLLADAGTATIVEPDASGRAAPLVFGFLCDGAKGDALQLPFGGTIAMDGFAVFRFVTVDVLAFIRDFLAATGRAASDFDAFVPHQANVFMIRQMAKKLGLSDRLKVSGDVLGNSSSASVPTTIAHANARGRLLVAGFGGGLSAAVGSVTVDGDASLTLIER